MSGAPCNCLEHPSGRSIRAVARALNGGIEADEITLEQVQDVFELIEFVQKGLEQSLAAGEGNEAIEDHFIGYAYDITALHDGMLEHIPALVREQN